MWFRVDDRFWQHRKLMSIPARYRNDAAGLWVRAGCWCAMNLSDGYIDPDVPPMLNATKATVTRLEDAGLWLPLPLGGWQMHDWEAWNPTRIQLEEHRSADRERKRRKGGDQP